MSSEERFDHLFMTIAQQSEGIEPLLDNMFSFLRRRTDFFTGAPPGQVEQVVNKVVRKHAGLAEQTKAEKAAQREKEERQRQERLKKKQMV
jgi:hypothetical protein